MSSSRKLPLPRLLKSDDGTWTVVRGDQVLGVFGSQEEAENYLVSRKTRIRKDVIQLGEKKAARDLGISSSEPVKEKAKAPALSQKRPARPLVPTAILRKEKKRWIIEDVYGKPIHQLPSQRDALLWWRQYTKNPKAQLKRGTKLDNEPISEVKSILPAQNAKAAAPAKSRKRRTSNPPKPTSRSRVKEPPAIKKFEDYNLPHSDDFGMPECDYRK